MLPRNVLAIRRSLRGPVPSLHLPSSLSSSPSSSKKVEILTCLTHKSSDAILLDYPTGAYTGMRTFDQLGIMDFTGHTTRLANSLAQIRFPISSDAHSMLESTPKVDPGTDAEAGVTDRITMDGSGSLQKNDCLSMEGAKETKEEEEEEEEEDSRATEALVEFRRQDYMKKEATELVRAGLKYYYQQQGRLETDEHTQHLHPNYHASIGEDETKVTVLCTWDYKKKEPLMIAHFEPLSTPKTPRCKVEIHGGPRHHATAKDSQWVRDRKVLLEMMDKDTNESLLMDEKTQNLYEGLSSNLYVLHKDQRTILTAPLDSVLQGTILKVVLNTCNEENIPVDFTFPNLKQIDEWEGAFISSTSRLVLPIEKWVLPDGSVKEFPESPTIELIRREVLKECQRRVERLLTTEELLMP